MRLPNVGVPAWLRIMGTTSLVYFAMGFIDFAITQIKKEVTNSLGMNTIT
jgi:hypothetical protein